MYMYFFISNCICWFMFVLKITIGAKLFNLIISWYKLRFSTLPLLSLDEDKILIYCASWKTASYNCLIRRINQVGNQFDRIFKRSGPVEGLRNWNLDILTIMENSSSKAKRLLYQWLKKITQPASMIMDHSFGQVCFKRNDQIRIFSL